MFLKGNYSLLAHAALSLDKLGNMLPLEKKSGWAQPPFHKWFLSQMKCILFASFRQVNIYHNT